MSLRGEWENNIVEGLDRVYEPKAKTVVATLTIGAGGHEKVYLPKQGGEWEMLGEMIGNNFHNLAHLTINGRGDSFFVERKNWEAVFSGVARNKSLTRLSFIYFHGARMLEVALDVLSSLPKSVGNLVSLRFYACNLSPTGVSSLSSLLARSDKSYRMKELLLQSYNYRLRDEGVEAIARALAHIPKLEHLQMSCNDVGPRGNLALATLVRNSTCTLEVLHLTSNHLTDAHVAMLGDAVATNNKLKSLSLANNGNITSAGWRRFFQALRPNSRLEELNLSGGSPEHFNDGVAEEIARCLTTNRHLKCMYLPKATVLFGGNNTITDLGWGVVERALCDPSSIASTFQSNHTLQCLKDRRHSDLPDNLASLLKMNKSRNKKQVARRKILQVHFQAGFDMEPFEENRMHSQVLPHLLAWIGKSSNKTTRSAMFEFLRRMPSLCGHRTSASGQKRKRDR